MFQMQKGTMFFKVENNFFQGIYDEPDSSTGDLNHAVLVVGYGTEKDRRGREQDFWLVKNR